MRTSQSSCVSTGIKAFPRTASLIRPCVRGIVVWALGVFQRIWPFKQQGWYCPICTLWWGLALIMLSPGKWLKENSTVRGKSIRYPVTEKSSCCNFAFLSPERGCGIVQIQAAGCCWSVGKTLNLSAHLWIEMISCNNSTHLEGLLRVKQVNM